jgi:hypothetical protein
VLTLRLALVKMLSMAEIVDSILGDEKTNWEKKSYNETSAVGRNRTSPRSSKRIPVSDP